MNPSSFFIVSCARSGSTSLARILDTAANGRCVSEPSPNLNRETRLMMEGRLSDPECVIRETVGERVKRNLQEVEIYGEKNVTYGPFIRSLHAQLNCKFVFLARDGRDVVRSLINWHEAKFGSVYRECMEPGKLTPEATAAASTLPVHLDTSDYARPRPAPEDELYGEWETLTRAEMCAYYWSRANRLYLEQLEKLPQDAWMTIDYTTPTVEKVLEVAEFCGLRGLQRDAIDALLQRRINSLEDRGAAQGEYPDWCNWDGGRRRKFDDIAGETMRRLGFYSELGSEWRPEKYGDIWRDQGGNEEWYQWMYSGRSRIHEHFLSWIQNIESGGARIASVADIGCGIGVGYAEAFADKRYNGVDVSSSNIEWCQVNRRNPRHVYLCRDLITTPLPEPVDLVFSSGTIDNAYGIDAFLGALVKNSRQWIYATFYRGWFAGLKEHRYQWSEKHKCFYNNASPSRLRDTLKQLGCRDIRVCPLPTGIESDSQPAYETLVIARVPDRCIE